uniref:FHA domain-containing protein n=1 Tax=Gongylonema pulchrum TaxID=637853 RepID=A0A183EBA1_9BILA
LQPNHSHGIAAPSSTVTAAPMAPLHPVLPPDMRPMPIRLKRAGEQDLARSSSFGSESTATNSRTQKMPRVEQLGAEATTSDVTPHRQNSTKCEGSVVNFDCRISQREQSISTLLMDFGAEEQYLFPGLDGSGPRNLENGSLYQGAQINLLINPRHEVLISTRMAQLERQQQANNWWFQQQSVAPRRNLIGLDIVAGRIASQPLVIIPRTHQQPIVELAMVLLQPHDLTSVGIWGGSVPPPMEITPVAATAEQISRFSTKYKFAKETNPSDNEQDRC